MTEVQVTARVLDPGGVDYSATVTIDVGEVPEDRQACLLAVSSAPSPMAEELGLPPYAAVMALSARIGELVQQMEDNGILAPSATTPPEPCNDYRQGSVADDVCVCGAAKIRHL